MEQTKDLYSGELFFKRRNNQKFARKENRILYNNRKAQEKRNIKAPVDRKLDKNRTILLKIIGNKNEIIKSKDFLLGAGFYFGFISFHKKVNGTLYAGIYEFGIRELENKDYQIIKF